jgi:DNA-binding transcriptional regulator YiaG
MNAAELRAELRELRLPQRRLAQRLGVDVRTVNRWAQGHLLVPQYAAAYLELLRIAVIRAEDHSCEPPQCESADHALARIPLR